MTATETAPGTGPTIQEQAPVLLGQLAGYVGHRTISLGLRTGLIQALADAREASTPDDLAEVLDLDPFYVSVWCRSALAAGVCEREGERYRLAPHMATLLLDTTSPAYVGGVFTVLEQREVFDRFEANLATGERMWWDDTSPEWIAGVAGTGTPFYTRLVPGGLAQVPGLADRLAAGCRVVDHACGAGVGTVRLARTYPACSIVGVDGDQHSLDVAADRVREAGVADRVTFVCSPLEEMELESPATLVVNNISMHECRDIDDVTRRVRAALEPGGWFVISDFPVPGHRRGPAEPAGAGDVRDPVLRGADRRPAAAPGVLRRAARPTDSSTWARSSSRRCTRSRGAAEPAEPATGDEARALGCDIAQGYDFARPGPVEQVLPGLEPLDAVAADALAAQAVVSPSR